MGGQHGSRWAPFVVFGGMLAIALTGLTVVLVGHCQRDEPYLDAIKVPYDPEDVRPIPEPIRRRE